MSVLCKDISEKFKRIPAPDILRGGAMILVMLYHLLYDLRFFYGVSLPYWLTPHKPPVEFVHICFLWVLFAVSGMCSGFSRDTVRRGAFLYIVGWLITAVTSVFMPSQLIVFGVLSCFGACMVITGLLRPLIDRIPPKVLFICSVLLWAAFRDFHTDSVIHLLITDIHITPPQMSDYLYPIGIRSEGFRSMDWFPVIPFIFIFLSGYALYRPVKDGKFPRWFYEISMPPLEFIGRHSLIFYALHQPLFLAVLEIVL